MAKYSSSDQSSSSQLDLYHPSLAEWFTQFCGPAFACNTEDGMSLLKEWKHSEVDKPDLVMGPGEEEEEGEEEFNEREALDSSKSLVECVRGDELSVSSCCWRPWQASTMWTDSEGRTAVIAACYMGHMPAVRELINWDADIEAQDH